MTEYKQKKKNLTQYDQLKDKRQKGLIQELQQYLIVLKMQTGAKSAQFCEQKATKNGVYDQIDEKVCLRNRKRQFSNMLIRLLPQISQHSYNYDQCMSECQKNTISYIVANQSCRGVYQKNFVRTTQSITKRLQDQGII